MYAAHAGRELQCKTQNVADVGDIDAGHKRRYQDNTQIIFDASLKRGAFLVEERAPPQGGENVVARSIELQKDCGRADIF